MATFIIIALAVSALVFIGLLFGTIFIVQQQTLAVVERFGKYQRIANPGINFKIPIVDRVVSELDMRVQQLVSTFETKTRDNVFVEVQTAVQYFIISDKAYDAHYKLENSEDQIKAYIADIIRSEIPKLSLDETFERKDSIAGSVKTALTETMTNFGYTIVTTLVTNIDPAGNVKNAMNEINTQQRMKLATTERAAAQKITVIAAAEAEAESMKLKGQGMADQRKAIIEGLKSSVNDLKEATGVDGKEAMTLVTLTSYFDMLEKVGAAGKVIFMNHTPGAVKNLAEEIRESIIGGTEATK